VSNFREGLWRLADPKISITSAASMAIGASLAAGDAHFSWRWLGVLAVAMFCMEVAKNAWGDVIDYDSGADLAVAPEDRTSFSGGKRVLVDSLLTRQQTWVVAFVFGLAGLSLGALIVFLREPGVFSLGCAALFLGWSYHGPPLKFAYRGLGELDVVIIYGPAIATATYMVMTGHFHPGVVWASLPLGVFIAAFLWVNQFPDFEADRSAGKYNLVARLGKHRASRLLPAIYMLGFGLLLLAIQQDSLPVTAALGLLAVFPVAVAVAGCWQDPEGFHRRHSVQPAALLSFVVLSAATSTGILLA
jgi:1,4-dihydroxy-2-naphthoate octaprenyltransferase